MRKDQFTSLKRHNVLYRKDRALKQTCSDVGTQIRSSLSVFTISARSIRASDDPPPPDTYRSASLLAQSSNPSLCREDARSKQASVVLTHSAIVTTYAVHLLVDRGDGRRLFRFVRRHGQSITREYFRLRMLLSVGENKSQMAHFIKKQMVDVKNNRTRRTAERFKSSRGSAGRSTCWTSETNETKTTRTRSTCFDFNRDYLPDTHHETSFYTSDKSASAVRCWCAGCSNRSSTPRCLASSCRCSASSAAVHQ